MRKRTCVCVWGGVDLLNFFTGLTYAARVVCFLGRVFLRASHSRRDDTWPVFGSGLSLQNKKSASFVNTLLLTEIPFSCGNLSFLNP